MDWKSFDEFTFKKRQEALEARRKEEEQRARYADEGAQSLQHLWDILQGGQPSRDYLSPQEGMLSSAGYIRDKSYDPLTALNDTKPVYPRPQWLPQVPGTLDEMPLPMRPGYERMHKLYAPLFTEEAMPNVAPLPQNGMLQVGGSPSTDMPAGGMNPLFQEMMRAERMKQNVHSSQLRQVENSMLPEAQRRREQMLNEQLENIQSVPVEDWLKGLVPGVNGQPMPNPNPSPRPQGSGVRGDADQSNEYASAGDQTSKNPVPLFAVINTQNGITYYRSPFERQAQHVANGLNAEQGVARFVVRRIMPIQ